MPAMAGIDDDRARLRADLAGRKGQSEGEEDEVGEAAERGVILF